MKKQVRILALSLVFLLTLSLFAGCAKKKAEGELNVTITVQSLDGSLNITKELRSKVGQSAWDLFVTNFEVDYEEGPYGHSVKGINGVQTDWSTSFFALYLDGSYATVGIDGVELKDGLNMTWKEEAATW